MDFTENTLSTKEVYNGKIMQVKVDTIQLPNGNQSKRELVVLSGASAVLAIKDGCVLLVKQYRKAVEKILIEIPAGKLEKDEDPVICAQRELEEETGYASNKLDKLGIFDPSPGCLVETIHLFYTNDLKKTRIHPDEDEFIEPLLIPIKEVDKMILNGEITDGKTVCAMAHYHLRNNQ